jgi:2-polyprenyl-6-hydroxyphenyl methylase/3-demethylubiquinone-9 3-methyltransferase
MSIGTMLRRRLGRFERPVAVAYRSRFVDVSELARRLRSTADGRRVLEVGCGDGIFTSSLAAEYRDAEVLGIDVVGRPGHLFEGDRQRVGFRMQTVQALEASGPEPFDVVVISDVLHHVPMPDRDALLTSARRLAGDRGVLFVKEWERRRNPAHFAAWASDRYVTGDDVRFETERELEQRLVELFPDDEVRREPRIGPRSNNVLFSVRALV